MTEEVLERAAMLDEALGHIPRQRERRHARRRRFARRGVGAMTGHAAKVLECAGVATLDEAVGL
jgi:hypothetical protein